MTLEELNKLITMRHFTQKKRKWSTNVDHKSAVTDHADKHNCVIEWEGAKVVDGEANRCVHGIKEAIWIREITPNMNRDLICSRPPPPPPRLQIKSRVRESARHAI